MPKTTYLYILAVILVSSIAALSFTVFSQTDQYSWSDIFTTQSKTNQGAVLKPKPKTEYSSIADQGVEGPFRVVKVRDGDTIELENGMTIRYLYVDTPETVKVGTPVQCFGPESSSFNKEYVYDKMVRLVKDKDPKDRYDRELRLVYLEGKDVTKPEQSVNAQLVKLGFATAKFYSPNFTYKKEFENLQDQAKEKKVGLWGTCEQSK